MIITLAYYISASIVDAATACRLRTPELLIAAASYIYLMFRYFLRFSPSLIFAAFLFFLAIILRLSDADAFRLLFRLRFLRLAFFRFFILSSLIRYFQMPCRFYMLLRCFCAMSCCYMVVSAFIILIIFAACAADAMPPFI